MIELKQIWKSFDQNKSFVVKDVSLTIKTGEIFVILGSSGSGKTTLLKLINKLFSLSQGAIFIDSKNINDLDPIQLRRSMGYHFQDVGLFPHLTVEENISIVLRLLGKPLQERKKKAQQLLELVNLPSTYMDRLVTELSGGQQQRVGVARALANDPIYLLMDEPFGAVDSITRFNLQNELLRLNQELKKTIVFVTHDISEACRLADRMAVMHEGVVDQIGTVAELLKTPQTEFVRDMMRYAVG